ncbi:Glycosyltransferase [Chitinispirillum alkaliphilum]|nr:Glycosyltransferase [Chitinispirillum alkaliphilum]
MKVLIQAYACSPDWGSEAGVGWNYINEIAAEYEVHAIVSKELNKNSIKRFLETNTLKKNIHFHYLPHSEHERALMQHQITYYLGYRMWQKRALSLASELHIMYHFDLTHILTFIGYRAPGYLYKLPLPCIWGPIGGAQNFPWKCMGNLSLGGLIKESSRNIANFIQRSFSIHYHHAKRGCSEIIYATKQTKHFLRSKNNQVISEVGCRKEDIVLSPKKYSADGPLKILWSGNHFDFKRLDLLIYALRDVYFDFRLTVLGDGHLTARWKNLARECGIMGKTEFKGRIPHHKAMDLYHKADIFVFTSLRETSGSVLLESLSKGLPVVAMALNGALDIVGKKESCGYLVPVGNFTQMVNSLRQKLQHISQNKHELTQKSKGAIMRAHNHTWKKNAEKIIAVYNQVLLSSKVRLQEEKKDKLNVPSN